MKPPGSGSEGWTLRRAGLLRALSLVCLVALGVAAYAPSFRVPFVFDDEQNLVENPELRELAACLGGAGAACPSLARLVSGGVGSRWVATLTFAVNYRLHGLSVTGYHLANLGIHLVAALLVWWLVQLTVRLPRLSGSALCDRREWVAWFTAAVFLLHPMQTQAVTYVVQRMASLAGLLCLVGLVGYVEWRRRSTGAGRWVAYAASFVSLVLAMKCKQNAAVFPVLVVLYEAVFFAGQWKRRLAGVLPHALTVLVLPWEVLSAARPGAGALGAALGATRVQTEMARLDYLVTQFRVVVKYLGLMLWPAGQNLDWDVAVSRSLWEPAVLASLGLLVVLGVGATWLLVRVPRGDAGWRWVGYGVLWWFVALSVESSVIPIEDVMFEHRVYLPSVGLIAACVAGLSLLVPGAGRGILTAALGAATLSLGTATWLRNEVWTDPLRLWTDSAEKSPGKARPLGNVATLLLERGRVDEAQRAFMRALELEPTHIKSMVGLANVALARRDAARALALLLRARAADAPTSDAALLSLGKAYLQLGQTESARKAWEEGLAVNPLRVEYLTNLGVAAMHEGRPEEARAHWEEAVRRRPEDPLAHFNLGVWYEEHGRPGDAARCYRRFLEVRRSGFEGAADRARSFLGRSN